MQETWLTVPVGVWALRHLRVALGSESVHGAVGVTPHQHHTTKRKE
jgi:hypothetical protein